MRLEALPGSVLDHKYRIERLLGAGAMGAVFQATHLGTTRPVAIKVIMPQLAENHEFEQRFKREAEAAGRLTHPNVVNVTDFGVTRIQHQDLAYLVMEYLEGKSLADHLKDDLRPSFDFLLDVVEQTGLALDASHAAGIVHRDLKPSNIWLEPDHRGGYNVKVLDFGIAKVANSANPEQVVAADAIETMALVPAPPDASLTLEMTGNHLASRTPSSLQTTAGTLLGTPAYMSPEQCTGMDVDARTDVYSMAAIAYQMLSGRLPFEAANLKDLIRQQIQTMPASPRDHDRTVPEALAAVVLSGLEKDPARRPPTAGTLAARLRAASEGELNLIRRSKDLFHTYTNLFIPLQLACLAAVVALLVPLQFLASWAVHAKWLPERSAFALLLAGFSVLLYAEFQFFKGACALLLRQASEKGQFPQSTWLTLRSLGAGLGTLLSTHLRSVVDPRPSSFWANGLWPVIWALEGRTGSDAIERSRQISAALPAAAMSLAVRQFSLVILGVTIFPVIPAIMDGTGGALHFFIKEVVAGTAFGWFTLFYPLLFGIMFLNFSQTYSLLYWAAQRCRNEVVEIALPAASRGTSRKSASGGPRPGTILWGAAPVVVLVVLAFRSNYAPNLQALQEASGDGRRTAVLRLLDAGLSVDQQDVGRETAVFAAVRSGDEKLFAELIKRGAAVNRTSSAGNTPLVLAARFSRTEMAKVLLERGAQVDAPDKQGRTPLMIAVMRGNTELARMLLLRGAKPALVDGQGKTAEAYAREEGLEELARVLVAAPK